MLRQALERAGVAPSEVSYVETHGTGTALGDPIEFEALAEVVGKPREDGSRCVLGAVKSNVGHLEAAAGVTGLIKVLLSLQHEAIPGNLHFKRLNPRMSLEGTPFVIPSRTVDWKRTDRPRIAGVSSFGISGTNAHVVVEEAPMTTVEAAADVGPQLVPMSARTAEGVRELAEAYRQELSRDGAGLGDVAYTASRRRGHHKQRLAVVAAIGRRWRRGWSSTCETARRLGWRSEKRAVESRCSCFLGRGRNGSEWGASCWRAGSRSGRR